MKERERERRRRGRKESAERISTTWGLANARDMRKVKEKYKFTISLSLEHISWKRGRGGEGWILDSALFAHKTRFIGSSQWLLLSWTHYLSFSGRCDRKGRHEFQGLVLLLSLLLFLFLHLLALSRRPCFPPLPFLVSTREVFVRWTFRERFN